MMRLPENKNPLVSIIIPTYNSAVYLAQAIDSALTQTYQNIEIIVVNDGSTDDTESIIAPYRKNPKVHYIVQGNKGLSGARNTGIRAAKGEYIALLDADDIFLPEKIKEQVVYMQHHPSCALCYCDLYHFWDGQPEQKMKMRYTYYSGEEVFARLLEGSFIAPVTVLIKKEVFETLGYFDEVMRQYAEDYEFWLRIARAGLRIEFLPKTLALLRMRKEGNIQGLSNQPKMKEVGLQVIERYAQHMTTEEKEKYNIEAIIARAKKKLLFAYLLNGRTQDAYNHMQQWKPQKSLERILKGLLLLFILVIPGRILKGVLRRVYYYVRATRLGVAQ